MSQPDKHSQAQPSALARAWRSVRNFVSTLFGPDKASDDRIRRQGQVHPRLEQRGRTFDQNPFG